MIVPNEIIIEITDKCNLNCFFCYNRAKNKGHDFDKDDVESTLANMAELGVKAVRFTGGEPLLREDLAEILSSAKAKGLYVILNTNGTLLSKNTHLIQYVDLFLFSMHSPEQFNTISENVKLLGGKEFLLATIAIRQNIHRLSRFYDFIWNLQTNHNNLCEWFFLRPVSAANNEALTNKELRILKDNIIFNNQQYNMDIKIANTVPLCAAKGLTKVCKGGSFDGGYTRMFIKADGSVYSDYFKQLKLGHIHNNSLEKMWYSPELKSQRNYKKLPNYCKECYLLEKCKGGLKEDTHLINPQNIDPIISIILPVDEALNEKLEALNKQRCRKNAFEVIITGNLDNQENPDNYDNLRITFANDKTEALYKARGKYSKTLNNKDIPEDSILKYISRKEKNKRNI